MADTVLLRVSGNEPHAPLSGVVRVKPAEEGTQHWLGLYLSPKAAQPFWKVNLESARFKLRSKSVILCETGEDSFELKIEQERMKMLWQELLDCGGNCFTPDLATNQGLEYYIQHMHHGPALSLKNPLQALTKVAAVFPAMGCRYQAFAIDFVRNILSHGPCELVRALLRDECRCFFECLMTIEGSQDKLPDLQRMILIELGAEAVQAIQQNARVRWLRECLVLRKQVEGSEPFFNKIISQNSAKIIAAILTQVRSLRRALQRNFGQAIQFLYQLLQDNSFAPQRKNQLFVQLADYQFFYSLDIGSHSTADYCKILTIFDVAINVKDQTFFNFLKDSQEFFTALSSKIDSVASKQIFNLVVLILFSASRRKETGWVRSRVLKQFLPAIANSNQIEVIEGTCRMLGQMLHVCKSQVILFLRQSRFASKLGQNSNKHIQVAFAKLVSNLVQRNDFETVSFLLEHKLVDRLLTIYLEKRKANLLTSIVEEAFYLMGQNQGASLLSLMRTDESLRFLQFRESSLERFARIKRPAQHVIQLAKKRAFVFADKQI